MSGSFNHAELTLFCNLKFVRLHRDRNEAYHYSFLIQLTDQEKCATSKFSNRSRTGNWKHCFCRCDQRFSDEHPLVPDFASNFGLLKLKIWHLTMFITWIKWMFNNISFILLRNNNSENNFICSFIWILRLYFIYFIKCNSGPITAGTKLEMDIIN